VGAHIGKIIPEEGKKINRGKNEKKKKKKMDGVGASRGALHNSGGNMVFEQGEQVATFFME